MTEVSTEHSQWLQGLAFYLEEVGILESRLEDCAAQPKASAAGADIEHFQNQLIIQRNSIEELRHAIREHMSRFGHSMADAEGLPSKILDGDHAQLREDYRSFEIVMNDLRESLKTFLSYMS